jgi:fructokinase
MLTAIQSIANTQIDGENQVGKPSVFYGGIDAGGTTFKCGIGDHRGTLLLDHRVTVSTPIETLNACTRFFREAMRERPLAALGIACFGPADIDVNSSGFGSILHTPKPGWTGIEVRDHFVRSLGLPTGFDTDVNGALRAEMHLGAANKARSAAYITVGTGIGAGLFLNGGFAGHPLHPEFGHITVKRHASDLGFAGVCPFHGDCLEGLASVSAMRARWGEPKTLSADHPGWLIIADYLAQACRTLTLTFRPEKIVIGGGLMLAPHLIGAIRAAYDAQMSGYLAGQGVVTDDLITAPGLGDDAGLTGALLLAIQTAL